MISLFDSDLSKTILIATLSILVLIQIIACLLDLRRAEREVRDFERELEQLEYKARNRTELYYLKFPVRPEAEQKQMRRRV